MKNILAVYFITIELGLAIVGIDEEEPMIRVGWLENDVITDITEEWIQCDVHHGFFFEKAGQKWYIDEFLKM